MSNNREIVVGHWVLLVRPGNSTRVSSTPLKIIRVYDSNTFLACDMSKQQDGFMVMRGNIYAVFDTEDAAKKASTVINNSYYELVTMVRGKEQYHATASRVFAIENGGFNPND